jgi:hypothetical protein
MRSGPLAEGLDGRKLFLLRYLFCDRFTAGALERSDKKNNPKW